MGDLLPRFADRKGNSILLAEWVGLQATPEYVTVRADQINGVEVSTIWLGYTNGHSLNQPLLFETVTFIDHKPNSPWHHRCWRYATEAEAIAGHESVCEQLRTGHVYIVKEEADPN